MIKTRVLNYIETKKELAENLRFIRECRELTQQEVASKLYIDRSTYSYYESGKSVPSLMTLIRLSEILNVKVESLITEDGSLKAKKCVETLLKGKTKMEPISFSCKVDKLGRIVIPKPIREELGLGQGDSAEIIVGENDIVLKKSSPSCIYCGGTEDILEYRGRVTCKSCINGLLALIG